MVDQPQVSAALIGAPQLIAALIGAVVSIIVLFVTIKTHRALKRMDSELANKQLRIMSIQHYLSEIRKAMMDLLETPFSKKDGSYLSLRQSELMWLLSALNGKGYGDSILARRTFSLEEDFVRWKHEVVELVNSDIAPVVISIQLYGGDND